MKGILAAISLFFLSSLTVYGQERDTTEVNRISRRINDFDIYETEKQAKDSIAALVPVIEEVVEEKIIRKKDILSTLESSLSDGSYYSVQVAACRMPLSQDYLDYRNYVEVYGSDGWYRYFSSRFLSLNEARTYMYNIRNTTKFKDAFPVRIKDFVKVNLITGYQL